MTDFSVLHSGPKVSFHRNDRQLHHLPWHRFFDRELCPLGPPYATVDGNYRGRLYRINLERGELQLDFSNVIVPVAADTVVELSDGINEIAF